MAKRLTTERLEFLVLNIEERERACKQGHAGRYGVFGVITEEGAMASELLELRRKVEQLSAAKDVQEIPSPPLGREIGRSPIRRTDDLLLKRLEADAQGYLARRQQEELRPGLGYALANEAWGFARRMEEHRREVVKRLQRVEDEEVQQ